MGCFEEVNGSQFVVNLAKITSFKSRHQIVRIVTKRGEKYG